MTDHTGELREADYGFVCWTVCSCGWRSNGYSSSAEAWTAHQAHVWARTEAS